MGIGSRAGRLTVMAALATILSGCAISTPFRGPGFDSSGGVTAANSGTVYVSITRATYSRESSARTEFWDHVDRVEDSLGSQSGFIGFSKRRELFGNTAWTMTVWTDRSSMQAFVSSDAHRTAIASSPRTLEGASFHGFEVSADEVPVPWTTALDRLASDPRELVRAEPVTAASRRD